MKKLTYCFMILGIFAAATAVQAVMPTPEVIAKLKAEGRWESYQAGLASARRRGLDQPDLERLAAAAAPVVGNLRALVILVDFADNVAAGGSATDTTYFKDLLFSDNDPATSLNDYYQENSYGKVTVTGDVVNWLRMPQTYAYYVDGLRGLGSYPQNSQRLAYDALLAADAAGVDFSLYDNDANLMMDGFFVVHAGPGFEETGDVNDIHSHKWQLQSPLLLDGVTISNYTMQPEEQGDLSPVNIGVFCHEFGHFYGLPDFYDTDGSSQGLDEWVLMAAGNYAKSDGSSPAHFSAWSKIKLGWLTPITVAGNSVGAVIPQAETDTVVYRLWTGGAAGNQYFLVENRQKVGFDRYLAGGGLLIYHVDDGLGGIAPNNNEWYPGHTDSGHYAVALEQADGLYELEKSPGSGPLAADGGDPWPGSTVNTSFNDLSSPDTRAYNMTTTQVAVWNISAPGSTMTANFDVVFSRPNFQLQAYTFADNGDTDGVPDPGEHVDLYLTHINHWAGVTDGELTVATDDPELGFSANQATLGLVATGDTITNATPITFDVPPGKQPRITDFYFTITAAGGAYVKTDTVRADVGSKQILLVDDDHRLNPFGSYDSVFLMPVLEERRVPYARWEVYSAGAPANMADYPMVFWYTGDRRVDLFGGADTIITPAEVAAIEDYLDGGGSLFITGQQIAQYLDSMDATFLNDYLRADYGGVAPDFIAYGVAGDVITDSTTFVLGGGGGAGNQFVKSLLNPVGGALPILTEAVVSNVTGIRYEGTYKLVFIGWGVEGIGDDMVSLGGMPKSLLINRVTDWLLATRVGVGDDDVAVLPNEFALLANYPNPFNPTTNIRFTIGPEPAFAMLTVYNLLGQNVRELWSGNLTAGTHEVTWDGRDGNGQEVATGVYFYRLVAGSRSEVRKMLFIK